MLGMEERGLQRLNSFSKLYHDTFIEKVLSDVEEGRLRTAMVNAGRYKDAVAYMRLLTGSEGQETLSNCISDIVSLMATLTDHARVHSQNLEVLVKTPGFTGELSNILLRNPLFVILAPEGVVYQHAFVRENGMVGYDSNFFVHPFTSRPKLMPYATNVIIAANNVTTAIELTIPLLGEWYRRKLQHG